jgi:hypothetical protein
MLHSIFILLMTLCQIVEEKLPVEIVIPNYLNVIQFKTYENSKILEMFHIY